MKVGTHYEAIAARQLQAAGLQVLERNFRCKSGELDLICRDGPQLVFVEVRYRRASNYSSAAASVTRAKQRRLIHSAQFYLQRNRAGTDYPCRFDVVTFDSARHCDNQQKTEPQMQWHKNAFTM